MTGTPRYTGRAGMIATWSASAVSCTIIPYFMPLHKHAVALSSVYWASTSPEHPGGRSSKQPPRDGCCNPWLGDWACAGDGSGEELFSAHKMAQE